ncbi:DUF4913 domain-containing protein [Nocardia farcinica]|uniref:DUF4913 domain-containing protein n=1 Tax=Nocardia farcinica TaxID=37329 RepID=UPI001894D6A6|nr:DUF4913 domain-containing protein [Nocardia farcinica]MBF6072711.1 DUF4913 domain-containing protein [Nocardia farcinica]
MSDTMFEFDNTNDGDEGVTAMPAPVIPQMDLGQLLDESIRKAVASQIAAEAKKIAAGVVGELLTPEVVAGMRETAVLEAVRALDPSPEAPLPGEQDPVAAEDDAEDDAAPPLEYRSLDAFVRDYLSMMYRREVVEPGSAKYARWCPRWWEHGEAIGRLEALWRAFEEARHGEGSEMSTWWLQHADPMMTELLSPNGPFKYCSVQQGHHERLGKLPLVPAPEGMFEDGHAHDPAPAVLVSSSLTLPAPTHPRRRTVMEFPE